MAYISPFVKAGMKKAPDLFEASQGFGRRLFPTPDDELKKKLMNEIQLTQQAKRDADMRGDVQQSAAAEMNLRKLMQRMEEPDPATTQLRQEAQPQMDFDTRQDVYMKEGVDGPVPASQSESTLIDESAVKRKPKAAAKISDKRRRELAKEQIRLNKQKEEIQALMKNVPFNEQGKKKHWNRIKAIDNRLAMIDRNLTLNMRPDLQKKPTLGTLMGRQGNLPEGESTLADVMPEGTDGKVGTQIQDLDNPGVQQGLAERGIDGDTSNRIFVNGQQLDLLNPETLGGGIKIQDPEARALMARLTDTHEGKLLHEVKPEDTPTWATDLVERVNNLRRMAELSAEEGDTRLMDMIADYENVPLSEKHAWWGQVNEILPQTGLHKRDDPLRMNPRQGQAMERAGEEHAALGRTPFEDRPVQDLSAMYQGLKKQGYSDQAINAHMEKLFSKKAISPEPGARSGEYIGNEEAYRKIEAGGYEDTELPTSRAAKGQVKKEVYEIDKLPPAEREKIITPELRAERDAYLKENRGAFIQEMNAVISKAVQGDENAQRQLFGSKRSPEWLASKTQSLIKSLSKGGNRRPLNALADEWIHNNKIVPYTADLLARRDPKRFSAQHKIRQMEGTPMTDAQGNPIMNPDGSVKTHEYVPEGTTYGDRYLEGNPRVAEDIEDPLGPDYFVPGEANPAEEALEASVIADKQFQELGTQPPIGGMPDKFAGGKPNFKPNDFVKNPAMLDRTEFQKYFDTIKNYKARDAKTEQAKKRAMAQIWRAATPEQKGYYNTLRGDPTVLERKSGNIKVYKNPEAETQRAKRALERKGKQARKATENKKGEAGRSARNAWAAIRKRGDITSMQSKMRQFADENERVRLLSDKTNEKQKLAILERIFSREFRKDPKKITDLLR